jgi:hypothetical protein
MTTRLIPEVGHWYAHRDKGQMFQVVAVDEEQRAIEIQDFDGDVDEIDFDGWHAMPLEPAEPPEDWTGPVDGVETDDPRYASDPDVSARDWRAPLDDMPAQPQEAVESDDADDDGDRPVDSGPR